MLVSQKEYDTIKKDLRGDLDDAISDYEHGTATYPDVVLAMDALYEWISYPENLEGAKHRLAADEHDAVARVILCARELAVASPKERARDRWCRYAAGAVAWTRSAASAAKIADDLLTLETDRFGVDQ